MTPTLFCCRLARASELGAALLALATLALNQVASAEHPIPSARIARFAGDRAAAITYTFDDNLRDQWTVAVPMLNEVGFKGTFFIIPGKTAETVEDAERRKNDRRAWGTITWSELKEMAMQGHEIGSHTWSHPGLTKLTAEEVEAQFTKARDAIKERLGFAPLTLAFPFNQSTPEIEAAALKYHVAFRDSQIGTSEESTVESLNAWADKQVRGKTWGILMAHAIGNGYAAFSDPEILRSHLKYVKSREREIWVDTFANVALYQKERDDTKLALSEVSSTGVTCTLVGTLDSATFDVPLTIVIEATATSARAVRAGRELPVRVEKGSIHVEAAPHAQPITVTWK